MFEKILLIPAFKDNYIWLLVRNGRAAVVDPGDPLPVAERLEALGLRLETILITHHHADHALLAGIFNQHYSWIWAATLVVICFAAVLFSLVEQSYATFVSAVLYTYIAVSYLRINFLMHHHILESTYFLLIYFIATSIMLIKYIREGKQKLFKA